MKWLKKGHEYDEIGNKFKNKQFYIYGCGLIGKRFIKKVYNTKGIKGFIDNYVCKMQKEYEGIPIYSYKEVMENKSDYDCIIIAASGAAKDDMMKMCTESGWILGDNLFSYQDIECNLEVFYAYGFQKNCLKVLSFSLTDKCNLRCKECALSFSYLKRREDRKVEELMYDIDILFSKFAYVDYLEIIGGEPFLYPNLEIILKYIYEKFHTKIDKLQITTNSTIIPSTEILTLLKEFNINICISDYNQIETLKGNAEKLSKVLDEYQVSYVIANEMEWVDFGLNKKNINKSFNEAIKTMDTCGIQCMTIRDGNLYYCFPALMAEKLFYHEDGYSGNNIDLRNVVFNPIELMEWTLGHREKGCLNMCRHCNGQYGDEKKVVIPGIQM